jgi:fructokinase
MNNKLRSIIFGEVLFDCFPGGEKILGGAPFNVAWHLQAFGDEPRLVSSVGEDGPGRKIIGAMRSWGMETSSVQKDPAHWTGRVDVALIDKEPSYDIVADCAYDYIDAGKIDEPEEEGILYHGTLALRNEKTRLAFEGLADNPMLSIFLDVNLRPPWWRADEMQALLKKARWVKLNREELKLLASGSGDIERDMARFQKLYELELVIVTLGAEGALLRSEDGGIQSVAPPGALRIVDTVGAGDAFTAVFIHGLISRWPMDKTIHAAQQFASAVTGLRGAISDDIRFYEAFNF